MRVVQLLPEFNEGGVERGVLELSRELVKRGVECITISAGGKLVEPFERSGGRHVALDVASKNPLTVPWRVSRLRRLLRELRPDILHARSRVPAWLTVLANRPLGIPLVTTVHGFNSVSPYSRVMTYGERVICVSGAIREYVRKHYAVPEERLVVIPRGVDLDLFDPARLDRVFMTRFTDQHELAGRCVVSSVGRITQLKDYETFIRAIGLCRAWQPDILGLVVGGVRADKEGYFRELQRLVAELGLQQHVRFTGSQERVAEIYALSRVVVSSSKKPESFGRAAAEALAMNVPVVATAHGGVLDIVRPGQTGDLFAVGDPDGLAEAIRQALTHHYGDLRGFVAEHFTLERMVAATLQVYRDVHGKAIASAPVSG